jgi:hypothetical protein
MVTDTKRWNKLYANLSDAGNGAMNPCIRPASLRPLPRFANG